MFIKSGFFALLAGLTCSMNCAAASLTKPDQLLMTNAKYEQVKDHVQLLSQADGFSLVQAILDDDLMQRLHDGSQGRFINLEPWRHRPTPLRLLTQTGQKKTARASRLPTLSHKAEVMDLYELIQPEKIWQNMQHLTDYVNRAAKTNEGVAAANWYKQQFDSMAREYGRTDVSSYYIETGTRYRQPSVVTVIGKGKRKPGIVIGAHIDTLSGNKPGADDDASGIAVGLEVSRVLLASKIRLDRPVYIIAYAAEEEGLVGSAYVVESFLDRAVQVAGVLQLDQAGYRANPADKTIWLIDDYVDPQLTRFTADLLTDYVGVPVGYTHCGYACSDHANWYFADFKASYPSATTLADDNPYVHTAQDRLDIISLEHMLNFTRLGLAFAVELGLDKRA
ncbi:M20/M25/M40 family metallo-hydrolase [Legionella sp. CNM-4043-24]|uniref:M20/M25/M40 family metallo-hydrolase n=1 Tax=Legionella sp. CNM-4043-24 TaxID=3421646 RepID=UPI00403AF56F